MVAIRDNREIPSDWESQNNRGPDRAYQIQLFFFTGVTSMPEKNDMSNDENVGLKKQTDICYPQAQPDFPLVVYGHTIHQIKNIFFL